MLDERFINLIDRCRAKGMGRKEVRAVLAKELPPEDVTEALKHYERTPLPDGRRRDQVNFGDPAEQDD